MLAVGLDAVEQALLAVFLARGAQRFGDAVAEGDQQVAGLEGERVLLERGVLEETRGSGRPSRGAERQSFVNTIGGLWPALQ